MGKSRCQIGKLCCYATGILGTQQAKRTFVVQEVSAHNCYASGRKCFSGIPCGMAYRNQPSNMDVWKIANFSDQGHPRLLAGVRHFRFGSILDSHLKRHYPQPQVGPTVRYSLLFSPTWMFNRGAQGYRIGPWKRKRTDPMAIV